MFDLQSSTIYSAIKWQNYFKFLKILQVVFWLAGAVLLVLLIPGIDVLTGQQIFGWLILDLIFIFAVKIKYWFFKDYLLNPPLTANLSAVWQNAEINLADYLDFKSALVLKNALTKSKSQGDFDQALIFELLKQEKIIFALERTGLTVEDFAPLRDKILTEFATAAKIDVDAGSALENIMAKSAELAVSRQHSRIAITDLLASLSLESPLFKNVMFAKDLDDEDIVSVVLWVENMMAELDQKRSWWQQASQGLSGVGIGKGWTAGWTYHLDQFVTDITHMLSEGKRFPRLVSRQREVDLLEQSLSGARQNNVILVGEPGVGKKTLVYNFAWRSLIGQCLVAVANKRILELDVDALLSGVRGESEIRDRLSLILKEAAIAGDVVLFIDQIQRLLSVEGSGTVDVSAILIPYLQGTQMQLIGATDYAHYHKIIERRPDLQKVIEKVEVNPPAKLETILVLQDLAISLEARYGVAVTYQAIRAAVNLADRYIQTVPFPEKAIDVLEQALILAQKIGARILDVATVESAMSLKTEVPVGQATGEEQAKLVRLDQIIHQRVVNQAQAINQVVSALQRSRAGVAGAQRPMGTFLFLGPTGVGKTETAKAVAEAYFGSEKRMIRLDMSEYQDINDLEKFLGSADGTIPGQLTDKIREDPFGLVLLDEIEKAHPKILNLFLQVLDEGRLTDAQGRLVSFLSTIIIATSNAGSEFIRQNVVRSDLTQGARPDLTRQLLDHLQQQGIFNPEWLNRFDAVVVYEPLSPENLLAIARLMLVSLAKRVLAERDIEVSFSEDLIAKVAQLGYDPQFGARPMRRVIQDRIETKLAQRILSGQTKRGDKIHLTGQDI